MPGLVRREAYGRCRHGLGPTNSEWTRSRKRRGEPQKAVRVVERVAGLLGLPRVGERRHCSTLTLTAARHECDGNGAPHQGLALEGKVPTATTGSPKGGKVPLVFALSIRILQSPRRSSEVTETEQYIDAEGYPQRRLLRPRPTAKLVVPAPGCRPECVNAVTAAPPHVVDDGNHRNGNRERQRPMPEQIV